MHFHQNRGFLSCKAIGWVYFYTQSKIKVLEKATKKSHDKTLNKHTSCHWRLREVYFEQAYSLGGCIEICSFLKDALELKYSARALLLWNPEVVLFAIEIYRLYILYHIWN